MKRPILFLVILLPLLFTACASKTTLRFKNETECGKATIKFTNTSTNKTNEYTIEEGKSVSIDISTEVRYTYTLDYAGRPGSQLKCESKTAEIRVHDKGETTINLQSATPTPTP